MPIHACSRYSVLSILLGESDNKYKFIMIDWLNKEQLKDAKLLWLVDKHTNDDTIVSGIRCQLPLLVPEDNLKLKKPL